MMKYKITITWDEEDQVFIATVPELAGCMAYGHTQKIALQNVKEHYNCSRIFKMVG